MDTQNPTINPKCFKQQMLEEAKGIKSMDQNRQNCGKLPVFFRWQFCRQSREHSIWDWGFTIDVAITGIRGGRIVSRKVAKIAKETGVPVFAGLDFRQLSLQSQSPCRRDAGSTFWRRSCRELRQISDIFQQRDAARKLVRV